ncbi:cell wall hydrolase [Sphingorhabdus sp.]|jgi:spore germination cell wall hydrolase CwlJ-like protein|uniref:cell wall hydrolase n=1 Tax=Sphingorhabdus sp. TaxID=1902408 RepID=UPI003783F06A
MLKFFRVASLVAVSCTLVSSVIAADTKAVLSNGQSAPLSANAPVFDPMQTTAEQAKLDLPKSFSNPNDIDAATASTLTDLVRTQAVDDSLSTEERCLASAVYFEAKGESLAGQLAVARVILARANSGRFPSTLCGVIFQKGQFSFVRGTSLPSIQMDSKHWRNAVAISNIALDNTWESPVEGALFFHARHVSPGWRLTRIGSVDNHIFYR